MEPPALPAGTWVHFDIETNPLSPSGDEHVYLWGLLLPPYDAPDAFHYIWTDSEADDRAGWMSFLDKVADLRQRYPDLVLAHYGNFEAPEDQPLRQAIRHGGSPCRRLAAQALSHRCSTY